MRYFPPFCMVLLLIGAAEVVVAQEQEALVYYSTNDLEITEFDRRMYLRKSPPVTEGTIGSRARNLQALSDLYALKVLASDADKKQALLTQQERDWIADYAVQLEVVNLYVAAEVDRRLAITDWDSEAMEVYLAESNKFELEERITIRSLLIRTENRSDSEARDIVLELLNAAKQPSANFKDIVLANTEDENAGEQAGLMVDLRRGQTVAPFEAAAFELSLPGELSEPVSSQFGVHLIQLVERKPRRRLTFKEVSQKIIDELRLSRAAEYRQAIQNEARERMPAGFREHTNALDGMLLRTSDGALSGG
ncbi:MAG: peptidylprolyl isomerase [Luminiphilus sp.]|nr:peptidylprolyl isomerase [Luminiphilus sp.]